MQYLANSNITSYYHHHYAFSWSTMSPTFRRKMKNAEILFQESAAQGDAVAQYNLGLLYMHGHGVSQDDARAVEWYTNSADQGIVNAQCILALCTRVAKVFHRTIHERWSGSRKLPTKEMLLRSPTWPLCTRVAEGFHRTMHVRWIGTRELPT